MTLNDQIRTRVQHFLNDVKARLTALSELEQQELLRQLESHIHEALETKTRGAEAQLSDLEAVLAEMDPPASYGRAAPKSRWSRLSQGQVALLLSLGSLAFVVLLALLNGGRVNPWIFHSVFLAGQGAALFFGIRSWPDPFGKTAVFTSASLTMLWVLLSQ